MTELLSRQYLSLFLGNWGQVTRPTNLVSFLKTKGKVTIVADSTAKETDRFSEFIPLSRSKRSLVNKITRGVKLFGGQYEQDLWNPAMLNTLETLKNNVYTAVFCHEPVLLPLALAIRNQPQNKENCKLFVDVREFYPRHFENYIFWRLTLGKLNDYIVKHYFSQADYLYTVSPDFQEEYRLQYGLDCMLFPSAPRYHNISPNPTSADRIRCIHHGGAKPGRKLELMIESMRFLGERFSLDMMLMPNDPGYLRKLKQLAKEVPNVRILDPVPMETLVDHTKNYDLGVFLLPSNTYNHDHTWPNKIFEYVQARLALAIGPSPGMAKFVTDNQVGVVAPECTAEAFAAVLGKLTANDIDRYKSNSHEMAKKYCWEENEKFLEKEFPGLFG